MCCWGDCGGQRTDASKEGEGEEEEAFEDVEGATAEEDDDESLTTFSSFSCLTLPLSTLIVVAIGEAALFRLLPVSWPLFSKEEEQARFREVEEPATGEEDEDDDDEKEESKVSPTGSSTAG